MRDKKESLKKKIKEEQAKLDKVFPEKLKTEIKEFKMQEG